MSKMVVNETTKMMQNAEWALYIFNVLGCLSSVGTGEKSHFYSGFYGMDDGSKRRSEITFAERIPVNSWERTSRCSEKKNLPGKNG